MADKQKISALIDGEDIDQGVINALTVDAESQQTWQDFNLIGDVMRGEAPAEKSWDIAANVALALENEPAHQIADQVVSIADAKPEPQLEAQPTVKQARWSMPAWLNQMSQVAVAACVSLAVIVGVQQYNGGDDSVQTAVDSQIPVLQTIPLSGAAEPVSLTAASSNNTVKRAPSEEQLMEQRRRINAMLQDYQLQLRLNAEMADEAQHVTETVGQE